MRIITREDVGLINKYKDSGNSFIFLNNNKPNFTSDEIKIGLDKGKDKGFEEYFELDKFWRCRGAFSCIVGNYLKEIDKPKHNTKIKPTAWKSIKYKDGKNDEYLYNRCHLIGRQLSTKKANRKGLITGTRIFNVDGMSKFENKVADYIKINPDQPVLYRVSPYFKGNNLLAYGVKMEAFSVKDNGNGICYNVFVYNNNPQFIIDYQTGEVYSNICMSLEGKTKSWNVYVIDMKTKKFCIKSCTRDCGIKCIHKMCFCGKDQTLIKNGYSKDKICEFDFD